MLGGKILYIQSLSLNNASTYNLHIVLQKISQNALLDMMRGQEKASLYSFRFMLPIMTIDFTFQMENMLHSHKLTTWDSLTLQQHNIC